MILSFYLSIVKLMLGVGGFLNAIMSAAILLYTFVYGFACVKLILLTFFFWLCTNLHIPITKLVLKKFLHENDMYHGFAFFLFPVDGLGGWAFHHLSCHNKNWNCK